MSTISEISEFLQKGRAKNVKQLVAQAIEDGDRFIEKAEETGADIICMSAILTTTMPQMQVVMDLLKERELREKYIIMVGGAPVNERFAEQIGADYYIEDAASCAEVARQVMLKRAAG